MNAEPASAFEQLQDDNLFPARIAAQHRSAVSHSLAEEGEVRARAAGRIFYAPRGGRATACRRRLGRGDATGDDRVDPYHGEVRPSRKNAGHDFDRSRCSRRTSTRPSCLPGLDDDFSLRRLERYITIAWESGAQPIIVLTKADLSGMSPSRCSQSRAVAIGVPVHPISNVTGDGLAALDPYLQPGRTVVLLGSSGVGKSTLLNRLAGEEVMATREVAADGTGRHTTTHRELVQLPGGGMVIDTPGLRELQFWEGDLSAAFGGPRGARAGMQVPELRTTMSGAWLRSPGRGRQRHARARPIAFLAEA